MDRGRTERLEAVVGDRFRLCERAGRGGMGVVYRALDLNTGNIVALKLLASTAPEDFDRFLREARLIAELEHPRIVGYVDHGQDLTHGLFLAMEWLEGHTLRQRFRRGPLAVAEAATLALHLAEALGAAHAHGVVHRDVKPENIFLRGGDAGRACLLDFGIARTNAASAQLTQAGTILGTPAYMAPEQASFGVPIEPPTDLFALGCVLYEALTGAAPFDGECALAVLGKVLFADAPHLDTTGDAMLGPLDDLVQRLLNKRPKNRPQTAEAVARELGLILAGEAARREVRAIGNTERRVVSVVASSPPTPPASAAAGGDTVHDTLVRSNEAAEPTGIQVLADGSWLAVMSGSSARDQALAAVRSARAMVKARPGCVVAVATGWAEGAGPSPMGEVLDRAGRMLIDRSDVAGVHCDRLTTELTAQRSELRLLAAPSGAGSAADLEPMVLGKRTTLVGRKKELTILALELDEAMQGDGARLLFVTGAAGSGKSRLRREVARLFLAKHARGVALLARGEALAQNAAFAALASLVRNAAHLARDDSDELVLATFRDALAELADPQRAEFAAVFLAELVGARIPESMHPYLGPARRDPAFLATHIENAFIAWLDATTRHGPALVAFDNFQWLDLPSARAMGNALAALGHARLAILALGRPETRQRFGALLEASGASEHRLGPLSPAAREQLARELLGKDHEASVAAVVAECEGLPLLLEELARATLEGRIDVQHGTLGALFEARIAGLAPDERRCLRAASVMGQRFWGEAVAELMDETIEVVNAILDRLVLRELVVVCPPRFGGRAEHAFRQSLLRDTAYTMLPEADRRAAHRNVAGWLERLGDPEPTMRAEQAALGAETEAQRLHAAGVVLALVDGWRPGEGSHWLARVRELLAGATVPSELAEKYASVATLIALYGIEGDALETAASWVASARALGNAGRLALATATRALAQSFAGRHDLAARDIDEAMRLMSRSDEPAVGLRVLRAAGLIAAFGGDYTSSLELFERGIEVARCAGLVEELNKDHSNAVDFAVRLGGPAAARAHLAEAVRLGVGHGCSQYFLGLDEGYAGLLDALDGDRAGCDRLRAALSSSKEAGSKMIEVQLRLMLGLAAAYVGSLGEARRELELCAPAFPAFRGAVGVHAEHALALLQAGKPPWWEHGAPPESALALWQRRTHGA